MSEKIVDAAVGRQIEFTIRQLDSLSTLPSVAARFLSQLFQFQLSPSALAELIESDPAITAKIFSLMHERGINFSDKDFSIHQALSELGLRSIRDAFLSLEVSAIFSCFSSTKGRISRAQWNTILS